VSARWPCGERGQKDRTPGEGLAIRGDDDAARLPHLRAERSDRRVVVEKGAALSMLTRLVQREKEPGTGTTEP
jgi:hypothetical protein